MNKADLISTLVEKTGLPKKDIATVVDATFEAITNSLISGEGFQLTGFGSFEVKERAERTGRNPATGETITIAASKIPTFKAGKTLKEAVNH